MWGWVLRMAVIAALCSTAFADEVADRPWATGVSEEEQAAALALYEAGNADFSEQRFAPALAKYRESLAHWDHPMVRFNASVALINLGQILEAYEHLEKALAYGATALGEDVHVQALTYKRLLEGQLAHLRVRCAEPDAVITLDGKELFVAPSSIEHVVLPGKHQLVATKRGYLTTTETVEVVAGKRLERELTLAIEKARPTLKMVRRWDAWKPWAVIGSGLAIAGVGGIVITGAAHSYDRYDAAVDAECPRGCSAAQLATKPQLAELRAAADTKQIGAISLFSLGGALVATGIVGAIINQPRARLDAPRVVLIPGGASLELTGRF